MIRREEFECLAHPPLHLLPIQGAKTREKGFFFAGSYYQNSAGLGEKWIKSQADGAFYIIESNGKLSKWNGGSSFTQVVLDGVPVVLGSAYWNDPTLLINAGATPPPDLTQAGTGTFTAAKLAALKKGASGSASTAALIRGSWVSGSTGNSRLTI